MGASWSVLGRLEDVLGRLWSVLGRLGRLGRVLGTCWGAWLHVIKFTITISEHVYHTSTVVLKSSSNRPTSSLNHQHIFKASKRVLKQLKMRH